MEVKLNYTEDVIEAYVANRKGVTKEDAEDLIRIFIKYLKLKMNNNEHYAINTPLGIFYKTLNVKMINKFDTPITKEQILNEKMFLNSFLKTKVNKDYKHEDIELIKENTNNHSIKN